MTTAFDEIDRVDVVSVNTPCTTNTSKDLGKYVDGDLTPREISEGGKSNSNSRINVSAGNPARNPNTKCST